MDNYMKVDPRHGLIEIKYGLKVYIYEPFVLAQQAIQVYYTPFPSREEEKIDGLYVKLSLEPFITSLKKKKSLIYQNTFKRMKH